MTAPGLNVERWVLRRQIDMPRTAVSHNLLPGRIHVLVDEDGANVEPYIKFLRGSGTREEQEKVTLEWNGESHGRSSWAVAGFQELFPEGATTTSFLQGIGVTQSELPRVLSAYDLSRYAHSACAQLSVTAQRQLSLIAALRSSAKILVLNDPFQPFSGRWREQFAEELLEDAKQKQRCILICNLSFMPQYWLEKPLVMKIDVQAAAVEAINRAIGIEEEQKRRAAQKAAEAAKAQALAEKAAAKVDKLDASLISEAEKSVPEQNEDGTPVVLNFMYEHVRDFIFAPLAELSNFLRGWSGAIAALGFVALTVSMAYVFVPALGSANSGFGDFARAWNKGNSVSTEQRGDRETGGDTAVNTDPENADVANLESGSWENSGSTGEGSPLQSVATWDWSGDWSDRGDWSEGGSASELSRWNYLPRLMVGEDGLLLDSCELE